MASSGCANGAGRTTLIKPFRRLPETEFPELEAAGMEVRLRQCAPALPQSLRSRTLENCNVRVQAHQRRQKRLQWQLAGTVAAVLSLQAMTLFVVESQNTQLLAGNSKPPLFASLSFAEIGQLWEQRSRQLARLMESSEVG